MEHWVRDLRGWGGVPLVGRPCPGWRWGSVAHSQWSNDCGVRWVQAAGGLLAGFPTGTLQYFLLWAAYVGEPIEGPIPASSLEGSPCALHHLFSARPDGN